MSDRGQVTDGNMMFTASIVIAIVVIIGLLGVSVMGQIGAKMDAREDALERRAEETYGDDYRIISGDDCYDSCVQTAIDPQERRQTILRHTDNADRWVTNSEISNQVPGKWFHDDTLDQLVREGLLERRDEGTWDGPTEYRYAGPDGKYEARLTDAELRERIATRLYVTDMWMTTEEIAHSVPADETRVKSALAALERTGAVKSGQETEGGFLPISHLAYAHESVDHGPPGVPFGTLGNVVVLVGLAAVIIGVVQRFRTDEEGER